MRTVWDIIKSPVITEKALVAKEETQEEEACEWEEVTEQFHHIARYEEVVREQRGIG